jgi:hypothetical protein
MGDTLRINGMNREELQLIMAQLHAKITENPFAVYKFSEQECAALLVALEIAGEL